MKRFYSMVTMLAVVVAALGFTACGGSDDDEVGNDNAPIVGIWECTQYYCDTDIPELIGDEGMQRGSIVSFKSDGIYSTDYDEDGRWSLKGNTLTLIKGNNFGVPFEYEVKSLTSTSLEISIDLKIAKVTYKFKRV